MDNVKKRGKRGKKNTVYLEQNSNLKILYADFNIAWPDQKYNYQDGLWDVPFFPDINKINYIISKDKSKTELAQYLHGCAFSPSLSTLQAAVKKGNFISWPGLEDLNFKKL